MRVLTITEVLQSQLPQSELRTSKKVQPWMMIILPHINQHQVMQEPKQNLPCILRNYEKRFKKEEVELFESDPIAGIKKKAEETGISYGILKQREK
jgi:hypothetical protein